MAILATLLATLTTGCFDEAPTLGKPYTFSRFHLYHQLLVAPESTTLRIDIDYMPGSEPHMGAFFDVFERLQEITPIEKVLIPAATELDWRPEDHPETSFWSWVVAQTESDPSGSPVIDGEVRLHVILTDDQHPLEEITTHNSAGASDGRRIYLDPTMYRNSHPGISVNGVAEHRTFHREYERRVLMHELGHVLGLVDFGIPMVTPRLAEGDPHHSENDESVMSSWAGLENPSTRDPRQAVTPIWNFDSYDLEDLKSYQDEYAAYMRGEPND